MEILQVSDLTKKYANGEGVERLSFFVHKGEIVALLGPNGAGKTTTIRCIAGLYEPDRGEIRIGGFRPGSTNAQQMIALIPDHPYLYPTLTVAEHVQFRARAFNVPKNRLKEKVLSALAEVNMDGMADRICGQLSRGQKQRVLLAGAIVRHASLYILDEPTVGLDIPSKQWLAEWLAAQANRQGAALVSTHSLEFVLETAHRVLLIRDGCLVREMAVPRNPEEWPAWRDEVIRVLGKWEDD